MPRKYRNAEERVIIYDEIKKGLNDLQVFENPKLKPLLDHMELFVKEPTSLRQFDGVIEVPELGFKIEYILPGRRIVRHGAKVSRLEEVTRGGAARSPSAMPAGSAMSAGSAMPAGSATNAPVASMTTRDRSSLPL